MKKKFLLAFSSVLVAFVIAEFAFRLIDPKENPVQEQLAHRQPMPYTMHSRFPYHWEEPKTTSDEFRIFMVGASSVESGQPPLPNLLGIELEKGGINPVRIFNYGVASQKSGQELAHIIYHILNLKPDLIILYDGGNDIMDPYLVDPRPGYPFNFFMYESNILFKDVQTYPLLDVIAYESGLLRRLLYSHFVKKFANLSELRKKAGYGTEKWRQEIADIYVDNLIKAQTISHAFGSEFVAFFQPLVFFKDVQTPREKRFGMDQQIHALEVRKRIRQELARGGKNSSLNVFDLSDIFDEVSDQVFVDYIHVSDRYNKIVAQSIGQQVIKLIKKDLKWQRIY